MTGMKVDEFLDWTWLGLKLALALALAVLIVCGALMVQGVIDTLRP
jgi:hypothetical protein